MSCARVRVSAKCGRWEVVLPDGRVELECQSLDEARRVALQCAARAVPSELVVHDAYHRVLNYELIDRGDSVS